MVKRAALSIRIPEPMKRAIDKAAARHGSSTAALVQKILEDALQAEKMGTPKKYMDPGERLAAGGTLLDLVVPMPIGEKILGDCTYEEIQALAKASQIVAEIYAKSARDHERAAQGG